MKRFLILMLSVAFVALSCYYVLAEDAEPEATGVASEAKVVSVPELSGAREPDMVILAPSSEVVDIAGEVESEPAETEEPVIISLPEEEVQAVALDVPLESQGELRLSGMKIGIDPGHQEHANSDTEPIAPGSSEMKQKVLSGTSGVRTGIPEYKTNLEISLQLRDALEALGATVYMTRETNDVDISNMERALMFNEWGVDLALRIHCNGASNSGANGAGTYARQTGEKQAESERAAEVILDALCEATGARRDGVFLRDTYTGQNWATVPCVMVEMGFMSNPEEDEKLNDPAYQKLLVQGMAEGVCRYFASEEAANDPASLMQGSRGEPVELLQQRLIELFYLDDVADGVYGAKTAAAVRGYQEDNGLNPTGIADSETQKLLFDVEEIGDPLAEAAEASQAME